MAQGFYELLGVPTTSDADSIREAYQRKLGDLVRSLRTARRNGADTTVLESQERALREAQDVLLDPDRRRRYDAFRRAMLEPDLPGDQDALWTAARASMLGPSTMTAMSVIRQLTNLRVGELGPMAPEAYDPRPTGPAPAAQILPDATDPRLSRNPIPGMTAEQRQQAMPAVPSLEMPYGGSVKIPDLRVLAPEPEPPPVQDEIGRLAERFGHDGRFFKGVREHRGLGLDAVAAQTRISRRYLEAIEKNDYDSLPAGTFVRGYVKEICRVLDLDDDGIVEAFMALYAHHRG